MGRSDVVLVLDEDDAFANAVSRALASQNMEVIHAPTMVAASTAIGQFDYAVLSFALPQGDTASVCMRLNRSDPSGWAAGLRKASVTPVFSLYGQSVLVLPQSRDPNHVADVLAALRTDRGLATAIASFAAECKLSPKEGELLRLAIEGLNNDEAADALGCRRTTVSSYWARIFSKTGVRCQRDVVATFVRFRTRSVEEVPRRTPAAPGRGPSQQANYSRARRGEAK